MVTTNVFKTHQKCQIIAIYVTIGTTNINITLSFVLHIGRDISAYEMNNTFENILLVSIETLVELLHNNSEAYSVNEGIAVLKLILF